MQQKLENEFREIMNEEMNGINGGGALEATQAFFGTVLIGCSPAVGVGVGIVAGPIAGVAAGAGLGALGSGLVGAASH